MKQSRLESAIEAWMNVLTGFFISWGMWVFVVAPLFAIPYAHSQGFLITCVFTVSSLARSYLIRRVFNNGWHKAAHVIAARLVRAQGSAGEGTANSRAPGAEVSTQPDGGTR